jgi:arylsulfatase A-like enzyme
MADKTRWHRALWEGQLPDLGISYVPDPDHPTGGIQCLGYTTPGIGEARARRWLATYYGMMSLVDDQLGRLFQFLRTEGLWDQTLIVFTSDHGEYLGDHWLFEKELFYEQAVRVPWIMRVPGFDAMRGQTIQSFVESVDLVPTLLELCGLPLGHRLQGRSLVPLLRGEVPGDWRPDVVTDWDYRFYGVGEQLGIPPHRRRAWMIRDERFKYVHFLDLPPMLFDLENDPAELCNLARDGAHQDVVARKRLELLEWRMAHEDPSRAEWWYRRKGPAGVEVPGDRSANYGRWRDPAAEGAEGPSR